MLAWLTENIGNIILCVLLLVIVGSILYKLRKNHKQGKTSCGCGCSNCAMNGTCHKNNNT